MFSVIYITIVVLTALVISKALVLPTSETLLLLLIAVICGAIPLVAYFAVVLTGAFKLFTDEMRDEIRWNNLLPFFLREEYINECRGRGIKAIRDYVKERAGAITETIEATLILSDAIKELYDKTREELAKTAQEAAD